MANHYLRLNTSDLTRIFHLQQNLEITLERISRDSQANDLLSVPAVLTAIENNALSLKILAPLEFRFNLFQPGRVVTIQIGTFNSAYSFKSKIIGRNFGENLELIIETPRLLANFERRNSSRVPLILHVTYHVLRYHEQELIHLAEKIGEGKSQNFSKGGLTLLTNLKLLVGMSLLLETTLEGELLRMIGIVRRVQKEGSGLYAIGIKFLELNSGDQELIIKAVDKFETVFKGDLTF